MGTWAYPTSTNVWGARGSQATCAVEGFAIHLGHAVLLYNLALAIYFLLVVKNRVWQVRLSRLEPYIHMCIILYCLGGSLANVLLGIIKPKGMVCMTGILGNEWTMEEFTPMGDIPSLGRLTVYMGESKNLSKELLQEFIDDVENGNINLNIDKVFQLDEVANAHEYMENNNAKGKIVVKT